MKSTSVDRAISLSGPNPTADPVGVGEDYFYMRGFSKRSAALGLASALTLTVFVPLSVTAAQAAPGAVSAASASTSAAPERNVLKLGSKGREVWLLEKKLKLSGANAMYGYPTVRRVKQIESWGKISRDGVVDAKTRSVISTYLAKKRANWLKARKAAIAKSKARAKSTTGRLAKIVSQAKANSGRPYARGGSGPRSFDCSGYTSYVVRKALGKKLPHQSGSQRGTVKRIARSAAKPGDLIFFHGRGGVYHVGIYAGGNKLYHASRPGTRSGLASIFSSNVSFGRVA